MKKAFIIISLLFFSFSSHAQWEYAYFVFDAGLIHNFTGPKPDSINNTFVNTPDGEYQLYTKTDAQPNNYMPYAFGYYAGLDFHYDLKSDNGGIVIGAKYTVNSFKYQYVTLNEIYGISQQLNAYSFSIPVYIKAGKKIFKEQKYLFFGGQYNYHLHLKEIQQPNWTGQNSVRWGTAAEITEASASYFAGFNYYTFRMQVEFTKRPFFNSLYVNANDIPIYSSSKGNYIFIKTSFTMPLNDWIFLISWKAEQMRRKLKFRR